MKVKVKLFSLEDQEFLYDKTFDSITEAEKNIKGLVEEDMENHEIIVNVNGKKVKWELFAKIK